MLTHLTLNYLFKGQQIGIKISATQPFKDNVVFLYNNTSCIKKGTRTDDIRKLHYRQIST